MTHPLTAALLVLWVFPSQYLHCTARQLAKTWLENSKRRYDRLKAVETATPMHTGSRLNVRY
jgi:hypothetical protein